MPINLVGDLQIAVERIRVKINTDRTIPFL